MCANKSKPKKYQLDHVDLPPFPKLAITQLKPDGTGEHVAWFFDKTVAQRFLQFLNTEVGAPRRHRKLYDS